MKGCNGSRLHPKSSMEPRRCRIHVHGGLCAGGIQAHGHSGVDVAHILDLGGGDSEPDLRNVLAQEHGVLVPVHGGA